DGEFGLGHGEETHPGDDNRCGGCGSGSVPRVQISCIHLSSFGKTDGGEVEPAEFSSGRSNFKPCASTVMMARRPRPRESRRSLLRPGSTCSIVSRKRRVSVGPGAVR